MPCSGAHWRVARALVSLEVCVRMRVVGVGAPSRSYVAFVRIARRMRQQTYSAAEQTQQTQCTLALHPKRHAMQSRCKQILFQIFFCAKKFNT